MTFRLVTLLYAFALFSAALEVLGTWGGCLATAGVLLLWASFRSSEIVVGCGVFVLAWVLLFAATLARPVEVAREAARSNSCKGHLKQLSVALLNYELSKGTLPPPVGSLGTSGHTQSWRVLILPFLESNTVYNAYNMNEPWNGPKNSKLAAPSWDAFECPTHGIKGTTSYLAVVGPRCVWNDGQPRRLSDITDDHSFTISIIDVGHSDISWKEPRDLTFDEAVELLTAPVDPNTFTGHLRQQGVFYKQTCYYNVAMVNTSILSIPVPLDRSTAVALLTANGGEQVNEELLDNLGAPVLRYDLIYGSILFVVLALVPAVPTWQWFRRSRVNTESNDQVEH